jgi:hypothetical protein
LLYELHDPRRYITPDVIADFSTVRFTQVGPDRVAIEGGGGSARPETLKVSVGYQEGYAGEGQISYAGPGAVGRGRLALAIVSERLRPLGEDIVDLRLELIGVDAVGLARESGSKSSVRVGTGIAAEPSEVRARIAARTRTLDAAVKVGREVEALYTNGPAGGGGATQSVRPVIAIESALLKRAAVKTSLHWEIVG